MRERMYKLFFGALISAALTCHGQSLADAARQAREKEAAKDPTAATKVITNDDLDPTSVSTKPAQAAKKSAPTSSKAAQDEAAFERNAEKTKAAILAQETKIKGLQAEIEKMRASIRYIETGVPANQNQLQKQQAADRMQERLDDENKKLAAMQEAARHAGYGNVVYEP